MKEKMKKVNTKLKVFIAAALLALAYPVFAVEEYVSEIYKQIDLVFSKKSESELNAILQKNHEDRYYYLIENYTEKKIRRLIVANDYEFALTATEVVIENNLDNERAVEMYSSIVDAYEVQQQYEQKEEEKKQKELARIEKQKEAKRSTVEKQYVSSKTADGGAVYVSGRDVKSSDSAWRAGLGVASLSFLTEQESGVNAINYGICGYYGFERYFNKVSAGIDTYLDFKFLYLGNEDSKIPLMMDFEILPKIGFPAFFRNFFVRAGLIGIKTGKQRDSVTTNHVVGDFYSPVLGIQLEDLKIGPAELTLNYDYYLGHLFYSDITSAMGAGAILAIPFTHIDKVRLDFNIGIKDKIFLKENGLENRANIILAIGAGNGNK
jgi:transcription elongation factor Elf1